MPMRHIVHNLPILPQQLQPFLQTGGFPRPTVHSLSPFACPTNLSFHCTECMFGLQRKIAKRRPEKISTSAISKKTRKRQLIGVQQPSFGPYNVSFRSSMKHYTKGGSQDFLFQPILSLNTFIFRSSITAALKGMPRSCQKRTSLQVTR